MVTYKYSLLKDIKNAVWILKDRKWFKDHPKIVVFWPSALRWVWLMFWLPFSKKPNIDFADNITCYWVSSGTWGAYHPQEKAISICPWKISKSPDRNIEGVIKHEITHLMHPEADKMPHEEKEKFIEENA